MNTTIIESMGAAAGNTLKETLVAADLNWDVQADKVAGFDTGIVMPGKKLLYRSDNNRALGVVGVDYSPSDPKLFVENQYEFAEFIGGKVVRVGFIEDRARAFAFVKMNDIKMPKELRQKGDVVGAYIYSTDGWDGGTPTRSRLYLERLACLNGMTSREIKADLWVSHTSKREETYEKRWKTFLNETQTIITNLTEQFQRLAEQRMDKEQLKEFLGKLIPGDSTRSSNRRDEIAALFGEGGTANLGATRWDALNAVTEYVTHHRTYRETDNTSAEVNRFLGVLETDTLRNQAMSLLLAN